jgi:hypothetical protein
LGHKPQAEQAVGKPSKLLGLGLLKLGLADHWSSRIPVE